MLNMAETTDQPCKHCGTHCGRIVGRGLGERCYYKLGRKGRLEEYPKGKPGGSKGGNTLHMITPEMHEQIHEIYQSGTGHSQVRELANRLGLPRWKVTRYAIDRGWVAKQHKEPNWVPEELRLLKEFARHTPQVIRRKLLEHGYTRSTQGIVLKRKRMDLLKELGGISATRLSGYLGVDIHFVTRAIEEGRLAAERRQTMRTEKQGGDSWFITPSDIRAYIIDNIHEIDIRKVDKYWFVSVLITQQGPSSPARKDKRSQPEDTVVIPFEAIHMDEEYFFCSLQRCTLKKTVCALRQLEGTGMVKDQCGNCAQGQDILREITEKKAA